MDLQKYALPLTVAASVAAIIVFLKSGPNSQVTPTSGAALPNAATVPTFASIPLSEYNLATPTPPPVQPGTGVVAYNPPTGVAVNKGFGAPTAKSDIPSPNGCGGCSVNATPNGPQNNNNPNVFQWWQTVYMNSAIL